MTEKALVVEVDKCTGCRLCEIFCSFQKTKTCNPARSRINVMKWEEDGINIPFMCQQCEDPLCAQVCPMNAIEKDEERGVIKTNYEKCIGCKMCIVVCPVGGATFDPIEKKVIQCDLCDGDPLCVKVCPTNAINFVKLVTVGTAKKRKVLERVFSSIKTEEKGFII